MVEVVAVDVVAGFAGDEVVAYVVLLVLRVGASDDMKVMLPLESVPPSVRNSPFRIRLLVPLGTLQLMVKERGLPPALTSAAEV